MQNLADAAKKCAGVYDIHLFSYCFCQEAPCLSWSKVRETTFIYFKQWARGISASVLRWRRWLFPSVSSCFNNGTIHAYQWPQNGPCTYLIATVLLSPGLWVMCWLIKSQERWFTIPSFPAGWNQTCWPESRQVKEGTPTRLEETESLTPQESL